MYLCKFGQNPSTGSKYSSQNVKNRVSELYFEPADGLKDFSIFSSGGHFVQLNGTSCVILVEGIMWNIHVKLF